MGTSLWATSTSTNGPLGSVVILSSVSLMDMAEFEEEFGAPNELDLGFRDPCSVLLTPRKRKPL